MVQTAETPRLKDIFDFGQIENLLRHFFLVTGLDTAFCDAEGREITAKRNSPSICASARGCEACRKHLSDGGEKSLELGEPYIYSCGCGLVMCSSPIVYDASLIGSIACGPVMLWEADEIAVSDLAEKTRSMNLDADPALLIEAVPSLDCVNITSAAQILFIMVNSLTREHSVYLRQRARITEQQATIAELIIERKVSAAELLEMENRKVLLRYPEETEKELIAFVQSGGKQQATKLLNSLLSGIFSFAEGNLETIRIKLFELIAFLSRAAVDAGAPLKEVNAITKASFEICEEDTDFERLCFLTTRAMEGFIDTVYRNRERKQTSVYMTRAIDYIMNHYMDDLPLGTVAREVYVSEYYLSHLFRKEMNQTFSDYVTKVRIEKARAFLREDVNARIQEVAGLVGFNDSNYFAKIFKKITGMSPRSYQAFFK
ncbi:MAG: PocR ligand-binding domain-containing protein [Treponema sp.]|jgi:two-component system response regulator YesN|nr:PocR ligand-binding domain-containing protein [Treponema sp.]